MSRSVLVLANPHAGRGRAVAAARVALHRLAESGCDARLVETADAAAAVLAARDGVRDGVDVVAVAGGDGTAHACLPVLAGSGTALGLLPAGSGNDLGRALGLPLAAPAAADVIATGGVRLLDLGTAGDRLWATVACIGLDSAVSARATRLRWPAGPRRYDVALIVEVLRLRPLPLRVTVDGRPHDVRATLVAVGNTAWYGSGLQICPGADPTDGMLEVTVVGAVPRRELLRVTARLRAGRLTGHPAVTRFRGRRIVLVGTADGRSGAPAYADGEPLDPLPLTVGCRRGALRVVVPTGWSAPPAAPL